MYRSTFLAGVFVAAAGAVFSSLASANAGGPDPTFGAAGAVILAADPAQTNYAYVNGIVVQPDAKIVMVGYASVDGGSLYRLAPSGVLDATFGTGGRVDTFISSPFGLALQPDGKFVVGGSSSTGLVLIRFNADGTLDTSFGAFGTADTHFGTLGGYVRKVLVQPDGKIIAIGITNYASSTTYNAVAVARFLPNGSLDTTFGGGGTQIQAFSSGSNVASADAVLQSDGKIVIVGYLFDTDYSPVLVRFTSAGQPDPGFSTAAPAAMGFTLLYGVVVQADGKLVLSGGGTVQVMHARLNSDGTPDGSYGTAGVAATPVSGYNGFGRGLALQPDGKVVSLLQDSGDPPLPRIVRLTTAGTLDASFGSAGIAAIPVGSRNYPSSMALQPDGKILAAGEIDTGTGTDRVAHYGIARYLGDEITGTIVEYFNTILGHYFITASAAEQASIDAGGSGPGWARTGYTFRSGGVSRACRFYGTPGVGPNSHFYTIEPSECALVKTDPGWHFESYDFSATPPGLGKQLRQRYGTGLPRLQSPLRPKRFQSSLYDVCVGVQRAGRIRLDGRRGGVLRTPVTKACNVGCEQAKRGLSPVFVCRRTEVCGSAG